MNCSSTEDWYPPSPNHDDPYAEEGSAIEKSGSSVNRDLENQRGTLRLFVTTVITS
jgi:hypothetical protein